MLPQPGEQSDATAEDNQGIGVKHRVSKQRNKQTNTKTTKTLPKSRQLGGGVVVDVYLFICCLVFQAVSTFGILNCI